MKSNCFYLFFAWDICQAQLRYSWTPFMLVGEMVCAEALKEGRQAWQWAGSPGQDWWLWRILELSRVADVTSPVSTNCTLQQKSCDLSHPFPMRANGGAAFLGRPTVWRCLDTLPGMVLSPRWSSKCFRDQHGVQCVVNSIQVECHPRSPVLSSPHETNHLLYSYILGYIIK